jgi:hypothetical protein
MILGEYLHYHKSSVHEASTLDPTVDFTKFLFEVPN